MRILGIIGILTLLLPVWGQAQDVEWEGNGDRIAAVRVAYLTERMRLTPEQAEKFWPLHEAMEQEKKAIEKRMAGLFRQEDISNDDADEIIRQHFKMEEELLQLKQRYYDKFNQVITPRQVLMYQRASREFKRNLIRQLQQRRRGG